MASQFQYTTQAQIRKAFWNQHPELPKKKINGIHFTDARVAFVFFVDMLERDGLISSDLAFKVTL